MKALVRFFRELYLPRRFYMVWAVLVLVFGLGFVYPAALAYGKVGLLVFAGIFGLDLFFLFRPGSRLEGRRSVPNKFSNGDPNPVRISIRNGYPAQTFLRIYDEVPEQFQRRDISYPLQLKSRQGKTLEYELRPVARGEYHFGRINAYAQSILGLAERRFRLGEEQMVPTYPSYLQLRKYELLAISNRLMEMGIKKIRRVGHNMEFEQIKEYVPGDDVRAINWKATARRNQLMINHYQEEKSQQVYSLIDMGRPMQLPFNELTLLDYAINASLVVSNVALTKDDKAGLIAFNTQPNHFVAASKRPRQMQLIQENLYNLQTRFLESDYQRLFLSVRQRIPQRALLLLYTNFATLAGMERELPFLQRLAKNHVVLVVFFKDSQLEEEVRFRSKSTEEIYVRTLIEQFVYEKKLIAKSLQQRGIYTLLTEPENLTINAINKYLELKARGVI